MGHMNIMLHDAEDLRAIRYFMLENLPPQTPIEEFNDQYCDTVGDVHIFLDALIEKRQKQLAILTNS